MGESDSPMTHVKHVCARERENDASQAKEEIMQEHYHAVVWIDHRQARVFHFNAEDADKVVVHPHHPIRDIHNKPRGGHDREEEAYLEAVTKAIGQAGAILVVGPAGEKNALVKHIERVHPQMKVRIEGVESADHPSDGELVAHARRYLKSADRMRPA